VQCLGSRYDASPLKKEPSGKKGPGTKEVTKKKITGEGTNGWVFKSPSPGAVQRALSNRETRRLLLLYQGGGTSLGLDSEERQQENSTDTNKDVRQAALLGSEKSNCLTEDRRQSHKDGGKESIHLGGTPPVLKGGVWWSTFSNF